MNMQHPCMMADPTQRLVTWTYPEFFPRVPFFLVYHPCMCGHEVTVEAVTVQSYLQQGLQTLQQREEINNNANQALADHLAQNYWYPPSANEAYENELREHDENANDYYRHDGTNSEDRRGDERPSQTDASGRPEQFRPLPENWLVYPEYEPDDEGPENRRRLAATRADDCPTGLDDPDSSDDENDEPER